MLTLLVAAADNDVIGFENQLPWHLPADLRRFKQTTLGHAIVMGRRTYDSIGRPLPGRTTLVVTRQPAWPAPAGVQVHYSLESALDAARALAGEVFVVGGAEIYRQALPWADRVLLTRVHATPAGDVFFPPLSSTEWRLAAEEVYAADERHAFPFAFQDWRRTLAPDGKPPHGAGNGVE